MNAPGGRRARSLRALVFLVPLALLGPLVSAPASAGGDIDPALVAATQGMRDQQEVAVIVTLSDRVSLPSYAPGGAGARDASPNLVGALRDKAQATQGAVLEGAASLGGHDLVSLWAINAVALKLPSRGISALAQLPGVASVRLDAVIQAPAPAPGGAALKAKRGRTALAGAPEWNISMLGAPDLWAAGISGTGVVVASLDSGVDVQHPDLASRWRGGTNSWFDPNGEHSTPSDLTGHGTQVMGLIVGGDAGGTSIGMAPGAKWIAAKIFNDAGDATLSGIHQAFQWVLDPDGSPATVDSPNVVNNSWGLQSTVGSCSTEFADDVAILRAAGVAVVFSAGNDGAAANTNGSPANDAGSLSVGAIDSARNVAAFSSRGPSACGGSIFPKVAAPGVAVRTADLSFGGVNPNPWVVETGTSFSAPHVTGAIALLWSAHPTATLAAMETILETTASDLGTAGLDYDSGFGLPDAVSANAQLWPPVAANDLYSVDVGATLDVPAAGLLGNDASPEGRALTASLGTAPASGSLTFRANGSFVFTPPLRIGPITFHYSADDGILKSTPATVTINVTHAAPVAVDDAFSVAANSSWTALDVLANDTVTAPATAVRTNVPPIPSPRIMGAPTSGGNVVVLSNGIIRYRPAAGFQGIETFRYRFRDSVKGTSNIATVTVTVQ